MLSSKLKFIIIYYSLGLISAYGESKMANILHMFELARKKPEILCLSVHPGGVRTNIGSNYIKKLGFFGKILEFVIFGIMRWCWRTPFQGREFFNYFMIKMKSNNRSSDKPLLCD